MFKQPVYLPGSVNPYSCGCVMIPDSKGVFNHYVHPKCKFDNGKTSGIEGYQYKPWELLPKELQKKYEHNIFTREF